MMERNRRRVQKGTVISNKMNKTVVVQVEDTRRHPVYGKVIKNHKKYYAHDESGNLAVGQEVSIVETRPLSKTKRWRVVMK